MGCNDKENKAFSTAVVFRTSHKEEVTYQLHSPEASDSQGVDDVEIRQFQVGKEGSFGFVSGGFEAKKWKFLRGANLSGARRRPRAVGAWASLYLLHFHFSVQNWLLAQHSAAPSPSMALEGMLFQGGIANIPTEGAKPTPGTAIQLPRLQLATFYSSSAGWGLLLNILVSLRIFGR